MASRRVLVTGARCWSNQTKIWEALKLQALQVPVEDDLIVIVGGARGADAFAEDWARRWGAIVERHPADWPRHGKGAGPLRNQEMVDSGADVCLAFPCPKSVGTYDCMRRAEKAGIPVIAEVDHRG